MTLKNVKRDANKRKNELHYVDLLWIGCSTCSYMASGVLASCNTAWIGGAKWLRDAHDQENVYRERRRRE